MRPHLLIRLLRSIHDKNAFFFNMQKPTSFFLDQTWALIRLSPFPYYSLFTLAEKAEEIRVEGC